MKTDPIDSILLEGYLVSVQKQLNGDIILQLEFADLSDTSYSFVSFPQYNVKSPVIWIQLGRVSVYLSSSLYADTTISCLTENTKLQCALQPAMKASLDALADNILIVSDVAGLGYALGFLQRVRQLKKSVFYLLDADSPLPVDLIPSTFIVNSLPSWVTATLPLVEDWCIPARVAAQNRPGCYEDGFVGMVEMFLQQASSSYTVFAAGKVSWIDQLPNVPDEKIELG